MPRSNDAPDAFAWQLEDGRWRARCASCDLFEMRASYVRFHRAFDALAMHLWAAHSLRRVWISRENPAYVASVQAALPMALDLRQRR